jgi:hypothetical protein
VPATILAGRYRYELTPDDVLWLGRSLACEAGGNREVMAGVAWTYASLLTTTSRPSLTSLIQAHSQPLNPIWRRDGSKCRAPDGEWYNRCHTTTTGRQICPCGETALARRERCSTLRWEQLAPAVRETVTAFLAGTLPNPVPRAVDFAAGLRGRRGAQLVREIGRTQFWSSAESRGWPDNHVRVVGPTGEAANERPLVAGVPSSGNGLTTLGVSVLVGASAYLFWSRIRA